MSPGFTIISWDSSKFFQILDFYNGGTLQNFQILDFYNGGSYQNIFKF